MNYKFRIGDYVETVDGLVGWICRMRDDGYIWWDNKNTGFYSCSYHMPEELKYFKRIGQYDFTKKDEGKIKPLPKEYNDLYSKINEPVDVVNELKTDYEKHLRAHELTER